MSPVSKEGFFRPIYGGKLDVHPSIQNEKWPYTCLWTFHRRFDRAVYGKSVGRFDGGTDYFIGALEHRT